MRKMFVICLALLFAISGRAQKPSNSFRQKVTVLKRFMDKNHYRSLQWNDSNSVMLYDHWLHELDDDKIYFTKKDLALFAAYKTTSSLVTDNRADFFSVTESVYRVRMREADSSINAYLSKPIDFVKPDLLHWPAADYANDSKELDLRRGRYLKWQVLDHIYDKLKAEGKTLSSLTSAEFAKQEAEERGRIKKRETNMFAVLMQTPADFRADLEDRFLDAMAWCYDPHSNYMNLRARQEFDAAVSAQEFTAGFTLAEDEKGDRIVDNLEPGSSAWKSGQLHKGDALLKIKNNKKEYDVTDLSNDELEGLLGESGDIEVTIKTIAGEIKKIKLSQEKITDEESVVKSYLIKSSKTFGYIDLPGFYSREDDGDNLNYNGCANDVSKELIKLKKDNIAGLIIDLRNNGGGSMWEAVQLAGIFIDAGPVASVKDKDGKSVMLKDPNRGTLYDGPMIVLTNGRSASASEFFSATMQDYNRALIVGGATYGKGTAQNVQPMDTVKAGSAADYRDFVKVTNEKFYRVNGSTVQWTGVLPDIVLPDIYAAGNFRENANASALTPDENKTGYYQPLPAFPLAGLKQKSAARVKEEPYYKKIYEFLESMKTLEKGIDLPLDRAGFDAFHQKFYGIESAGDSETKLFLTKAENNSYDREKLSLSSGPAKEGNTELLEQLSRSSDIAEACKILEDLISNK